MKDPGGIIKILMAMVENVAKECGVSCRIGTPENNEAVLPLITAVPLLQIVKHEATVVFVMAALIIDAVELGGKTSGRQIETIIEHHIQLLKQCVGGK